MKRPAPTTIPAPPPVTCCERAYRRGQIDVLRQIMRYSEQSRIRMAMAQLRHVMPEAVAAAERSGK